MACAVIVRWAVNVYVRIRTTIVLFGLLGFCGRFRMGRRFFAGGCAHWEELRDPNCSLEVFYVLLNSSVRYCVRNVCQLAMPFRPNKGTKTNQSRGVKEAAAGVHGQGCMFVCDDFP